MLNRVVGAVGDNEYIYETGLHYRIGDKSALYYKMQLRSVWNCWNSRPDKNNVLLSILHIPVFVTYLFYGVVIVIIVFKSVSNKTDLLNVLA